MSGVALLGALQPGTQLPAENPATTGGASGPQFEYDCKCKLEDFDKNGKLSFGHIFDNNKKKKKIGEGRWNYNARDQNPDEVNKFMESICNALKKLL